MRLRVKYVRLSRDIEYEYRFVVSVYSDDDSKTANLLVKPTEGVKYTNDKVYEFFLTVEPAKPIVVVVSALGPIRNDYGRRCWRNCGTSVCHLDSATPNSAKLMCNMAYGISEEEKLSGILYCTIGAEKHQPDHRIPAFEFQKTRGDGGVAFKMYTKAELRRDSNSVVSALNAYEKNIKSIYTSRIHSKCKLLRKLNSLWVPLDYYYAISTNKKYRLSETDFRHENLLSRPGLPDKKYELLKSASACAREGLEILKATTTRGLPFFAALFRKTPKISIDYWKRALSVTIDRFFDGDSDDFYRNFCESFEPGRKACYAAQLISLYTQSLEYVTDYVPIRHGKRDKKEVEQFSSALINMSSDCEDMSVAMFQCYEAFAEADSSVPDDITTIDAMGVLSRMKKILKDNYIPMIFADVIELGGPDSARKHGNYAGAKTANEYYNLLMKLCGYEHAGASPRLKNYRRADDSEMISVNKLEVVDGFLQSAESAHICMKLIPKSWFKKAVSRFDENATTLQSATLKNIGTQKDDETLPVLFMEGTSLLFASDEEPTRDALSFKYHGGDTFTKSVSSYLLREPYLNDVCKSINVPDKGFSKFYKGSAFACTTKFKDVGSYMFATCRKSENDTFEKGISHDQLSYKSKAVHFIPYASLFDTAAPECDPVVLNICSLQKALDHDIIIESKRDEEPKSSTYSYLLNDSLHSDRLEAEMEIWKTTLNDLVLDPSKKHRSHVVPTADRVVSKIIFDPYYANHSKTMASLTFQILSLFYDVTIARGDRHDKTAALKNWSKKYVTAAGNVTTTKRFFDEEEFDKNCQTNYKHVLVAQNVRGMFLATALEKVATDVYQFRIEVHLMVDDK